MRWWRDGSACVVMDKVMGGLEKECKCLITCIGNEMSCEGECYLEI